MEKGAPFLYSCQFSEIWLLRCGFSLGLVVAFFREEMVILKDLACLF
ncbi:hypothetical protein STRPS_0729 [Streptococcus pseudoporcinus LQ 940-04]|uniref:Uncharacterized protein n=1 Tax=Streptococcus pseudoporcinus LQ 940-04 TaxID=875093 RepID=G5K9I5_9STRE|nr:hypothetical protein STRPS_0729 [Streptococcus pseudoporcinus LQ 940-04]